jgi:hypothetical protein
MDSPEPVFDIFSGVLDKDAVWVESVRGLANARERMERIAVEKPGPYFVFYTRDHSVLHLIDTSQFLDVDGKSKDNVA